MKRRIRNGEHQNQANGTTTVANARATACAGGRRYMLLAGLFAAALLVGFLAYRWLRPGLPEEVVGTWRVQGGEQAGAVLEFRRDGSFQALMDWPGKREKGVVEARVEVEGETIRFLSVNPITQREEAKMQTIKQLTETEMVLEDQRGARSKLIRVE
jgi:uncharacterized protein (TIGR03066 family)